MNFTLVKMRGNMGIGVISFDVWDTLIIDDSDEAYRESHNLPTKKQERISLYHDYYNSQINDEELIHSAIHAMENSFTEQWKKQFKTPGIRWRLNQIEKLIGKELGKPFILNESQKIELIKKLEEMELKYPIKPMPGAKDFLSRFTKSNPEIKLGIISDAIYSPGSSIRKILQANELLSYFSYFSFSDEVGNSKPSPNIFSHLCVQAESRSSQLLHIGDREVNDIIGAKEFGAQAVMCKVMKPEAQSSTTYQFSDYNDLDSILKELL